MKYFLRSLKVFFFNNINVKVYANFLLDNFDSNYIVLVFLLNLINSSRFGI